MKLSHMTKAAIDGMYGLMEDLSYVAASKLHCHGSHIQLLLILEGATAGIFCNASKSLGISDPSSTLLTRKSSQNWVTCLLSCRMGSRKQH